MTLSQLTLDLPEPQLSIKDICKFMETADGKTPFRITALITSVSQAFKKNGDPYLTIELSDRRGSVPCKRWDVKESEKTIFHKNNVVSATVLFENYHGTITGTIQDDIQLAVGEDPKNYCYSIMYDVNVMVNWLRNEISELSQDPDCKKILDATLANPDYFQKFISHPAAVSKHHNVRYGLLLHTFTVAILSRRIAEVYEKEGQPINMKVLRLGAIIHDFGKLWEYEISPTDDITVNAFQMHTNPHLLRVFGLIERIDAQTPIDPQFKEQVEHLVCSHHGKIEYGAIVVPQTPEAVILHFADSIDAQMYPMLMAQLKLDPGESVSLSGRTFTKF